jgi:flagellar hook-associated protein 3 FlgL
MRISTQSMSALAVSSMVDQQAQLAKLQAQVASGKKVSTPADDPVAAVHILELERAQSESEQFGKNSDQVKSRLTQEEQALADTSTLLQRVRELAVQAGNTATLSNSDRQSLAAEMVQRRQQLTDIANRKDGSGEYLFAGLSTQTQPFSNSAGGNVVYQGDQASRVVQVSSSERVADGNSGYDVFMNLPAGNGTFSTGVKPLNTGSGIISTGSVIAKAAWVPDTYTVSFPSANAWQVLDGSSAVIASGTYTAGSAISFNGVQVNITGTPAAGDSFTVAASAKEDMFTSLDRMIAALQRPSGDAASAARLSTDMTRTLQQMDQANDNILGIRAQVGARLNQLDDAGTARDNLNLDLATSLSNLRDLDYAKALTTMNQRLVGLQAAQQAYTKISQLSLFHYL